MSPAPSTAESTRRFLVILWIVLFVSIGMYYYLTTIIPAEQADPNSPLIFPFLSLAILMALASVYYKARFGARDDRPRTLAMIRVGYVVALVFDEVPAMLGFVVYLLTAWPQHWLFYIISATALVLNFPQRETFEQAGRNL